MNFEFWKGNGRNTSSPRTPTPQQIDQSSIDKGLVNRKGENTCFLNVVIQSLWHLKTFRAHIQDVTYDHQCTERCLLCALSMLFAQFSFSNEEVIPPDILRQTLAEQHKQDERFQLGQEEDAHEALNVILQWFHCNQVKNMDLQKGMQVVCQPKCISHKNFGCQVCTMRRCRECNATSEPETEDQFLFSIYATELAKLTDFHKAFKTAQRYSCPQLINRSDSINQDSLIYIPIVDLRANPFGGQTKLLQEDFTPNSDNRCIRISLKFRQTPNFSQWRKQLDIEFNEIYKFVSNGGTLLVPAAAKKMQITDEITIKHDLGKDLPLSFRKQLQAQLDHVTYKCPGPAVEERHCFSIPEIFSVNINWPGDIVDENLVYQVHNKIPEHFDVRLIMQCFDQADLFQLKACVAYYGRHYIAFCWSEKQQSWLKFDDSKVKRVGRTWPECRRYATSKNWRLTTLFYETTKPIRDSVHKRQWYVNFQDRIRNSVKQLNEENADSKPETKFIVQPPSYESCEPDSSNKVKAPKPSPEHLNETRDRAATERARFFSRKLKDFSSDSTNVHI